MWCWVNNKRFQIEWEKSFSRGIWGSQHIAAHYKEIVKYFLLYMLPRKHNVQKGLEMDVAHSASTFSKEYLLQTGRTFVKQLLSRFEVPTSDLSRMTGCLLKLMGWLKYVHKCISVKAWNLSIPIHTELASKTSPMFHIQIIDRTYLIPYSKTVSGFSIATVLGRWKFESNFTYDVIKALWSSFMVCLRSYM